MTSDERSSGVRIFPPFIFAAGIAAGFLMEWAWPMPLVSPAWASPVRWLGAVLIAAWLALAIWAVRTFRGVGTSPNPTRPTTALALGGPYRFTRNPMYLGLALFQAGAAAAGDTLWPLALLLPVLWTVWRAVIRHEERYLEEKFGAEYVDYKARVERWL